jgi:DNA polymerase IIIc chi subunit
MTEIRFYHLQGRKPEEALPGILEAALAQGLRAVVEAPVAEWIGRASCRERVSCCV